MYKVNGIEYNYNSSVNQNIKDVFVSKNVFSCVNTMVEYILQKGHEDINAPFTYEDITNYKDCVCSSCKESNSFKKMDMTDIDIQQDSEGLYICPACKCEYETEEAAINCCDTNNLYQCANCGQILSYEDYINLDTEEQEVYEWYIVSSFLSNRLNIKEHCIIKDFNIWGRGTTGQAIYLDNVISEICYEMEILEGQKNEWKVI